MTGKYDTYFVKRARDLWADETRRSTDIATELGMTKNAFLGLAHREGFPKRSSPIRGFLPKGERQPTPRAPIKRNRVVKAPPAKAPAAAQVASPLAIGATSIEAPSAPEAEAEAADEPQTIFRPRAATGCCSWPIGEPRTPEFRMCDAPRQPFGTRLPYCPEHVALARRKVEGT